MPIWGYVVAALGILWIVNTVAFGRLRFWRAAAKWPELALAWMQGDSEVWKFCENRPSEHHVGPFAVEVRGLGETKVWADERTMEASQDRFLESLSELPLKKRAELAERFRRAFARAQDSAQPQKPDPSRPREIPDELVQAAREGLPRIKRRFLDGLGWHETLMVRVLLRDEHGADLAFIVIDRWEDQYLHGVLANEMSGATTFERGKRFAIDEDTVLDWAIVHPNGEAEGNILDNHFNRMDELDEHVQRLHTDLEVVG